MKLLLLLLISSFLFFVYRGLNAKKPSAQARADLNKLLELDMAPPSDWPVVENLLQDSALSSIKISLKEAKPSSAIESKFGGLPFWPEGKDYPRDKNGQVMIFIAQINFSELPQHDLPYPTQGLLQFFIANNDLLGLEFIDAKNTLDNYLNGKKDFAVIYHADVSQASALNNALRDEIETIQHSDRSPLSGESALNFSLQSDLASPTDYRFSKILSPLAEISDEVEEYAYETLFKTPAHQLSGYATFTQEDPRAYLESDDKWLLLFQMDTDSNALLDIMWGDAGIGNFFIRAEDLENLNFDKVWYSWDCS